MKLNAWSYLGDGVYAKPDPHGVWLHANSHNDPTDRVYLELFVLEDFIRGIKEVYNVDLSEL